VTYTWTHFAKALEDAVEDNKEGEDTLDWLQSAADDEAQDTPEQETKGHGLLAADAVHEEATDQRAGEVEAVDDGAVSDVLDEAVAGLKRSDDGGAEDAKGVRLPQIRTHAVQNIALRRLSFIVMSESIKGGGIDLQQSRKGTKPEQCQPWASNNA
jgi:hypothetical protein